jgi:hypothetical protein
MKSERIFSISARTQVVESSIRKHQTDENFTSEEIKESTGQNKTVLGSHAR